MYTFVCGKLQYISRSKESQGLQPMQSRKSGNALFNIVAWLTGNRFGLLIFIRKLLHLHLSHSPASGSLEDVDSNA